MANIFKKMFKREVPMNGGNSFEVQKQLTAREEQVQAYVLSGIDDTYTKENLYTWWELLQFQADYNASMVRFTFNDSYIDSMLYMLIRCGFLYGNVGIYFINNEMIPLIEGKSIVNDTGKIIYVEGYSAYEVWQSAGMLADKQTGITVDDLKIEKIKTKLNKEKLPYVITGDDLNNYIRLYVPSFSYGAYVRWIKFIRQQDKMLKKINTYSYLLTKKIIYEVNDIAAANVEIQRFYKDEYPFLINLDAATPNGNKFIVDGPDNAGVEQLFYYYNEWLKIYYEMLGRRLNVDKKSERNITSEVEASQEVFTILENEYLVNRINFLQEFSKRINKPIIFLDKQEETENSAIDKSGESARNKTSSKTRKSENSRTDNQSDSGENG